LILYLLILDLFIFALKSVNDIKMFVSFPWFPTSPKPGEVGEMLALYRLKSLSLDYKAKLKSPCFFLQVTLLANNLRFMPHGKADCQNNRNQSQRPIW
jgi:hypothetical protein